MIVKKYNEVENNEVIAEGVKNTHIRWLIGDKSAAPNFYLRLFEIEPNGHTPYHSHPWEHEFENTSDQPLKFLCVIPTWGKK